MKRFLSIALLISVYSCSNESNKNPNDIGKLKDSLEIKSDSFNVQDLVYRVSLQSDIPLDTINISRNKRHTGITIVIPKLSRNDYPEVFKLLRDRVENKKKEFYEWTKDDVVEYDSSIDAYRGCSMTIEPKSLYQTEKVISFAIEVYNGCDVGSSGFEYNVINFNIEKKKQISLSDYFVLKTTLDTTFLEKIIGRAINRDFSMSKYLGLDGHINFSFDKSYVYFYFDKYDMYSWGISSVKKEYIFENISPIYR